MKAKLAILDMNDQVPNQGMRCIKEIVSEYQDRLDWDVFDVRGKNELPDMSYDIFISSGGPGSPLEEGLWRDSFLELLDQIRVHNAKVTSRKKFVFFICYSFQIACQHFGLGDVTKRRKTSFGVYPVHKTKAGKSEPILEPLDDPYYAIDSRDWQVVQPRLEVFEEHGAQILSLEKIRTHVEYERAIMSVRFSPELVGTQFHPEADSDGMLVHLSSDEMKNKIVENFNADKYFRMLSDLNDPEKVEKTHSTILPKFISMSLAAIEKQHLVLN